MSYNDDSVNYKKEEPEVEKRIELRCSACGTKNPDASSFCMECGVSLVIEHILPVLQRRTQLTQGSWMHTQRTSDSGWALVFVLMLLIAPIAMYMASIGPKSPAALIAIGIIVFVVQSKDLLSHIKGNSKNVKRR
ncbi:hypothetical protein LCGC14_0194560 [marine sediment metagenome]|uniref:Zinc-ribbon domain-containing protein n=1 Tax=marine sediment metagenome TaxID=412755 RepID=A0A0F9UPQ2_9ZZZZ